MKKAKGFPDKNKFVLICCTMAMVVISCSDANERSGDDNPPQGIQNKMEQPQQTNADGKNGSTARFTVLHDKLYAVSGGGLAVFDLASPEKPSRSGFSAVSSDIETLFNDGERLFIGAESALYIYSIDDPNKPSRVGQYGHIKSCNPVVTSGTNAFVTLRSDRRTCDGKENNLVVIDVKNPEKPVKISSVPMNSPAGLGILDTRLFVCDDGQGLKEFNVSDTKAVKETATVKDEICFDVIPLKNTLITTGADAISQYDISEAKLTRISRIEIEKY